MGKEVTNLKPATIFAFCCRVCSQIVFTVSWFDSWSAGGFSYAVFGVLESYTIRNLSISWTGHSYFHYTRISFATKCGSDGRTRCYLLSFFRYAFSSEFLCHGIVHIYVVICNIKLTANY